MNAIREVAMAVGAQAEGFEDFYRSTSHRLLRHLYALTGDMGDAQDIVQESYARAWQRWSRVGEYDAPEAWVRQVATRLAVSRWRRVQGAHLAWRRLSPKVDAADLPTDVVLLVAALKHLPVRQRTALVLHYLTDLSVEQVAEEMQSPIGSVKSWLARGRKALAAQIGDETTASDPTTTGKELS